MDECLKLLRGSTDEQRLVGLLLATKFVSGDDIQAVREVFEAIGFPFINRLLKTGMGRFAQDKEPQQNYLHLAITILAAFCRVPELAFSDELIDRVPVFVEVLSFKPEEAVAMDASECLLAIATASERGFAAVCESNIFHVISVTLLSEAREVPAALNLMRFLVTKITMENKTELYAKQLALLVSSLARHFSSQRGLTKFVALDVLRILLIPGPTRLLLSSKGSWPDDVRFGLGQILHSRVGPEHRSAALELAEEMVEIRGNSWLMGKISFPDADFVAPPDRFILLVVESLRVEVALTLREVSQASFNPAEQPAHQGNLAIYYALLERIVDLISEEETSVSVEETSLQVILTEVYKVMGEVLEGLENAKDDGRNQGDALLSSVRLLGRFLAELPSAHKPRVLKLLGFMLSITTEGEKSSFYAVQFMIPALLQLTEDVDSCEALLSSGGHKQIVSYIVAALNNQEEHLIDEALEILLNVLEKKDILFNEVSYLDFVPALPLLAANAKPGTLAITFCMTVIAMTDEPSLNKALVSSGVNLISTLEKLGIR